MRSTAFISLILLLKVVSPEQDYTLKGTNYPLVLLPLLDELDVPQAFRNKNYLKFLFKCVFFEGHCDIIGKWLKPRAMAALFGSCLVCTPHQNLKMEEWLSELIDRNPRLFRAAMVKVCYDMNLEIDAKDLSLIRPFLKQPA